MTDTKNSEYVLDNTPVARVVSDIGELLTRACACGVRDTEKATANPKDRPMHCLTPLKKISEYALTHIIGYSTGASLTNARGTKPNKNYNSIDAHTSRMIEKYVSIYTRMATKSAQHISIKKELVEFAILTHEINAFILYVHTTTQANVNGHISNWDHLWMRPVKVFTPQGHYGHSGHIAEMKKFIGGRPQITATLDDNQYHVIQYDIRKNKNHHLVVKNGEYLVMDPETKEISAVDADTVLNNYRIR